MAGHSKWANIKHRKARQDGKRAKVWTKVIREVTVAARLGGSSVEDNPRLRAAVDNALSVNMPRDTIDRAVARGARDQEGNDVEELVYEGYGPGGVAILVEAMTDNKNRTVAEVRHAFTKHGGKLGTDGSVAYLFDRRGLISFAPGADEDEVMNIALDAGAEDVESDDDVREFWPCSGCVSRSGSRTGSCGGRHGASEYQHLRYRHSRTDSASDRCLGGS